MGRGARSDSNTATPVAQRPTMDVAKLIRTDFADPSDPLNQAWRALARSYQQRFGDPAVGRTRMTFFDGDYVWKVPRGYGGVHDNEREARWSSSEIPLAACELIHEMPSGVPVLKMERVEPVFEDLPDWTGFVDCQQVGLTRDGRLVAYDL